METSMNKKYEMGSLKVFISDNKKHLSDILFQPTCLQFSVSTEMNMCQALQKMWSKMLSVLSKSLKTGSKLMIGKGLKGEERNPFTVLMTLGKVIYKVIFHLFNARFAIFYCFFRRSIIIITSIINTCLTQLQMIYK